MPSGSIEFEETLWQDSIGIGNLPSKFIDRSGDIVVSQYYLKQKIVFSISHDQD